MLKVLAVKIAANSFHRKAYFDRIQECLFNQYVLERLSGPPYGHFTDELETNRATTNKRKHKNAAQSLKILKEPPPKTLPKTQSENLQSKVQYPDQTFDVELPRRMATRSKLTAFWHKGCRKLSSMRTQQSHGMHMQQNKSNIHAQADESGKAEYTAEKEMPHHKFINIGHMTPQASTSMQVPDQNLSASQIPTSARTADTVQQEKLQELTSEVSQISM